MKTQVRSAASVTEFAIPEGCWILEIANDADDPDVSISRARVPHGATTEWHRLTGVAERYVIISGNGRVELDPGIAADLGPGDVVRIPPGVAQRIANTGEGDLIFYCVCTPRFTPACYEAM